jgi:hypothetical protein
MRNFKKIIKIRKKIAKKNHKNPHQTHCRKSPKNHTRKNRNLSWGVRLRGVAGVAMDAKGVFLAEMDRLEKSVEFLKIRNLD